MNTLENKIAGAVYGFAIGDAMGGVTEFMHSHQIKKLYGKVDNLIGGGWLNLEPGEVTDDTQMSMCVMDALMHTLKSGQREPYFFGEHVASRFIDWYHTNPKDIGAGCERGIVNLMEFGSEMVACKRWHNKNALGNGSLMRALPCALYGPDFEEWNTLQGRLTHNNNKCSRIILSYSRLVFKCLNSGVMPNDIKSLSEGLVEPLGDVKRTYNNALYWAGEPTYYDAIVGAVNNGGDSDTIAAIAGSIAGANFGINAIPSGWIAALDDNVKIFLNKFIKFTKNYLQTR